ncbi:unnamed protein product, partial [Prorocentrum cordatum]
PTGVQGPLPSGLGRPRLPKRGRAGQGAGGLPAVAVRAAGVRGRPGAHSAALRPEVRPVPEAPLACWSPPPAVAKLLLNLPMGRLADEVGRKLLMVGGMAVCAVADVGTGLATGLVPLVLSRLLLGAGISSSDTGAAAWVADATEERPERRASFLGLQSAVLAAAFVLGPTLGGMVSDQYGMSSLFFTVAGGASLCALGYATLPELWQASERREQPPSFQELIETREQRALAGISVAFYCGTACKISLIPSVANEAFGASPTEVGQLFSAIAALAIVGTLVGGQIADAFGPRRVLVACGSVCALGYVGAAAGVGAHSRELFLGSLAVWALAAAVKSPALQAYAISAAPEDSRGAALSVPKTVGDLSYAVAPFALGAADDRLGPEAALAICAGTFAAGTAYFAAQTATEDDAR